MSKPAYDIPGLDGSDGQELAKNLAEISIKYHELITRFVAQQSQGTQMPEIDPHHVSDAFAELGEKMMANPSQIIEAQFDLWKDYTNLWQSFALRAMGQEAAPVVEATPGDRRFKGAEWDDEIFDFIRQSYLLTARWFTDTVANVEGLDDKTRKKVQFFTRQFVDAMSPSNFVLTNPHVLKQTIESKGANLLKGLENVIEDLERGDGKLAISMTDEKAFEVGVNIATSPGKVIFQNDILQLIQYEPSTESVYERPLLIMPPWINKFYILDLQPKNSMIRWACARGYTVFVVSWVNPDTALAEKTFEDYMFEGPLAALDAIEAATGAREVNAVGYCIGGTLLSATLAYMAEKGDERITAATFFATQVDFSEAGDLEVFIDEAQLATMDRQMAEKGYMESAEMANTFNMLRANDLIWSFVVNNYLLGKEPVPFDLLYWNADATRMPRALHSFYLRNMYFENKLAEPGGITLGGVPIDLGKVTLPVYLQASREDHIAPYASVFKAVNNFQGPTKFALAGSGHIAGVINPPDAKKYQHWLNPKKPKNLEEWLEGAEEHPGSWWPNWDKWLAKRSGKKVPARIPGDGKLTPIEDAPGSYVRVRG